MVQLRTMIPYRKQNQAKNLDLDNFDYAIKGNQKLKMKKNQNLSCEKFSYALLSPKKSGFLKYLNEHIYTKLRHIASFMHYYEVENLH